MSEFSTALSDIIRNNNISIYSLAKTIGCDRTWIQKAVIGERKMNFSNFTALYRELINKVDEKTLSNLYEKFIIDYYGEREYKIITYIKERLEATKRLELYIKKLNCVRPDTGEENDFSKGSKGKEDFDVNQYICEFQLNDAESSMIRSIYEVIEDEFEYAGLNQIKPRLYMNIPCEWRSLQNLVLVLLKIKNIRGNIDFKYMAAGNQKNDIEIMQLEQFLTSVEFASYGYSTIMASDEQTSGTRDNNALFPYYIITSTNVAMITEDGKLVVKNNDESVVKQITERVQIRISQMQDFLKIINPDTYSSIILSVSLDELNSIDDICSRICVTTFCTKDIFKEIVPDYQPNRDFTIETLDMVYGTMRKNKLNMYYTIESVRHFMETSESKQEGQYFNLEFTQEIKIELLSKLYDYYSNNEESELHMLKAGKYLAADDIHIFNWGEKIICATGYVYFGDMPVDAMSFVHLPGIAGHMSNYNQYMMNSNICLDKENSLKVLKNLIESYK